MKRPLIALTLGDPAGIGPEIVLKALDNPELIKMARVLVIGERQVLEQAMGFPGCPRLKVVDVQQPKEGSYLPGQLNLLHLDALGGGLPPLGQVSAACGRAAYAYIEKAIQLAMDGQVDAVATTPINKEALRAAGVSHIGHTEIFGELTGTADPLTLFEVRNLRVFFLSRHVSLRQACDLVKKERIMDYVRRCSAALRQLGIREGSMAIAGLNPHSGENGLFGYEELREVMPAVKALQEAGYAVAGPIGADSVFAQALQGKYNSVLSLYHDQGHIATKTLDFERTIAITLGLPILRTSVDHGTAFDIAGQGIASPVSLVEAVRLAAKYAPHFHTKAPAATGDTIGLY